MSTTTARIKNVQFVRDHLAAVGGEDAELLLSAFGFMTPEYDLSYQDCLLQGDDDNLAKLASFIRGEDEEERPANEVGAEREVPLKIFASHLSAYKAEVGKFAEEFERFGIELFVAHVSINPDEEWAAEIEKRLRSVPAGLVFLHEGFSKSAWCDQETGWMLGRGVPLPSLKFGQLAPYGPLGKKQAITVNEKPIPTTVEQVLDIYEGYPSLGPYLAESFVLAMERSPSFNMTDRIWRRLRLVREMTSGQCKRLLSASINNSQVRNAYCAEEGGRGYPDLIEELVQRQASYTPSQSDAPF